MNHIIVTEKTYQTNPIPTQNEVAGTWLFFKQLFLPTLCTSSREMAKFWVFFLCYLTCLTLFCHFVSHAYQEMTDFFTGIHRPRKTTTTKTEEEGRFIRLLQKYYLKDSFPVMNQICSATI